MVTRVPEFTATKIASIHDEGDLFTVVFQSEQRELSVHMTRTAREALVRQIVMGGNKLQ